MRYYIPAVAVLLFTASCNKPECTNTNPILKQYSPADKEYKAELARLLSTTNSDSIIAWIAQQPYAKEGETEYMYVDLTGRGICATAEVDITGNEQLAQFRSVEGKSYSGAMLSGFEYHISQTDSGYNFVLDDIGEILD